MTHLSIGSDQWIELIINGAKSLNIAVDREMAQQLAVHAAELILWNQKVNLTAITDPVEIAVKHVLDSMAAAPFISDDAHVLDIGSGGGFPGIVLKIVKPEISVVLVDASRKKVSFLKHVIRLLSLKNIEAIHTRTEAMKGSAEYMENFDVVTCRAFSSLGAFVGEGGPFMKKKGMMIAYKGKDTESEIQEYLSDNITERREFLTIEAHCYILPESNIEHSLVVIKKSK